MSRARDRASADLNGQEFILDADGGASSFRLKRDLLSGAVVFHCVHANPLENSGKVSFVVLFVRNTMCMRCFIILRVVCSFCVFSLCVGSLLGVLCDRFFVLHIVCCRACRLCVCVFSMFRICVCSLFVLEY